MIVKKLNPAERVGLLGFALALGIFFLIANRGAYQGFYSSDDFDNIAQGRGADLAYYGKMLLNPKFGGDANFRPAAALYYFAMPRWFDLHFNRYVAAIHAIHLLNVLLIWLVARSLGASVAGACAAALLFAFHMGMFAVYWAPMYVFDLVCGTFILLALLTYVNHRLFVSVVFFWLALKSKESAILFPFALAACEYWLGPKKWKRLIPFFCISLLAGAEALIFNAHRDNAYSLVFSPSAVWTTVKFYAPKLTLLPIVFAFLAILAIVTISLVRSNQSVRFGVLSFVVLLAPLLLLPGRLFGAYLYIPLIGLALAISAVTRPIWLAAFFVLWIPWNYRQMRIDRNTELAAADERRAWFAPIADFVRSNPAPTTFVYAGAPDSMAPYGISGALSVLHPPDTTMTIVPSDAPESRVALSRRDVVLLTWQDRKMIVTPRAADVVYVRLKQPAPLWQLGDGWIDYDRNFRWIGPHATARLSVLPDAKNFELIVYVPGIYIERLHEGRIEVSLNQQHVGTAWMREAVPSTYRFPVPANLTNPVEVEFSVDPPLKDPNGSATLYGAPIAAFGFVN